MRSQISIIERRANVKKQMVVLGHNEGRSTFARGEDIPKRLPD